MDLALETFVYGLNEMRAPQEGRVLFLNAQVHRGLSADIRAVQWFKPYYDALNYSERYACVEEVAGAYDTAYILFPKNVVEGRYLIAQALRLVGQGGMIYVSAENKAGGNRLQKIVQPFGAEIVQQISKNKSRFVAYKMGI